eukprot:365725-Chlamydomonas_euryale.AAC.53
MGSMPRLNLSVCPPPWFCRELMVVAGPWLSALYVIGVMIVGIFMILNLFLALLLSNLDQLDETDVYPTSSEQAQEARHDDDDEGHDHDHASSRDPAGRDGSLYLPKQSQQYAAQNHGDWLGADGRCDDTDSLIGVGTEQDEHTRMIKPSPRAWSPGAVSHSQASEPGLVKTAFYGGTVVPLPPILAVPLNPPDMNKARRRASLTQGHFAWGMEHSRSMMPDGVLPNSQLLQATSLDVPPGPQSPEGQQARLEGNSLFLLSPTNPIRVALYQVGQFMLCINSLPPDLQMSQSACNACLLCELCAKSMSAHPAMPAWNPTC